MYIEQTNRSILVEKITQSNYQQSTRYKIWLWMGRYVDLKTDYWGANYTNYIIQTCTETNTYICWQEFKIDEWMIREI